MKKYYILLYFISITLLIPSCQKNESDSTIHKTDNPDIFKPEYDCTDKNFDYHHQIGCDGKEYPNPITSEYVLPFPPDVTYRTGLTNCSSSYHAPEYPDRYAFDFNMPIGDSIYAARGGKVVVVVDDQPSEGGGGIGGNGIIIDHYDHTYGIYLHSPNSGIFVNEGDTIKQGQFLAISGRSGLAGYPHLHFIVVQKGYQWPYDPIPITFKNVYPPDVIIQYHKLYTACSY